MRKLALIVLAGLLSHSLAAKEYHVSVTGSDKNEGSVVKPFKTITAAARIAQPGDVVTVHSGTYRERINPPRGGKSETRRIIYQAAEGERVIIKGSEVVNSWEHIRGGVWKVTLPNSFFGEYNPYKDLIVGDWFKDKGRGHHTGEVYLNGKSLFEKVSPEEVVNPEPYPDAVNKEASLYTWYCESDEEKTTIWANFHDYNPNRELVEINVRKSCFYPAKPGRNYITVRGFHLSQAATQWSAPTAEQIGLLGTHWSKGWIIENNVISHSKCAGITLGKDRKSGHNVCIKDPSKGGAVHYNEVIQRALKGSGWSKENIGSHIVRNNTIFDCEQAGICGSLGAVFSEVIDNHIFNIWTKRQFDGAEIAGIKLHGAIDTLISNNLIHNAGRGMWMDWMAQGTRITGNACYKNSTDDFFSEVNHGPYLVDNNIFLSRVAVVNMSHGGAYVHNLVAGLTRSRTTGRKTPYLKQHSTQVAGLHDITEVGDVRFYNNIFVAATGASASAGNKRTGHGLSVFDDTELPMHIDGNIYLNGAKPYAGESNCIVKSGFDPEMELTEENGEIYLHITLDSFVNDAQNKPVTTDVLGRAKIPDLPFVNPDDTPLKIESDYLGGDRSDKNPTAGPFENPGRGRLILKLWPVGGL